MKYHVTPTDKVRELRDEDFLVSKTNPKGIITYCNQGFIDISGYSEAELLGKQHNIVRHPDMPRGVFKIFWDTISQKKEIFAYVKNMAKDGAAYWVFANVTASIDEQGNIIGYFSVRRKPKDSAVKLVSELYREMLEIEKRAGTRDAIAASTEYLQGIISSKGSKNYEDFIFTL